MDESKRQALIIWLNEMEVKYEKLHRECADGVLVAKIIKKFQPRLVDLHNYTPCSGIEHKVNNWQTLNKKVLTRLNLQQSKASLERLARGDIKLMERLLYEIMLQEEIEGMRKEPLDDGHQNQVWSEDTNIVIVSVTKQNGDSLLKVPQKMIKFSMYEELIKQANAKQRQLEEAHGKIAYLENLLQSQTEQVDELQAEVGSLSRRTVTEKNSTSH